MSQNIIEYKFNYMRKLNLNKICNRVAHAQCVYKQVSTCWKILSFTSHSCAVTRLKTCFNRSCNLDKKDFNIKRKNTCHAECVYKQVSTCWKILFFTLFTPEQIGNKDILFHLLRLLRMLQKGSLQCCNCK